MFEESTRMAAERGHSNAWEDPKTQVKKKGGALGFMYEAPPGYIPDEESSEAMVKRVVADKGEEAEEEKEAEEPVAAGAEKGGGGEERKGPDPRSIQPLGVQVSSCGSPLTEREFFIFSVKGVFFIENLLVRIQLIVETILVDRPCAMGV